MAGEDGHHRRRNVTALLDTSILIRYFVDDPPGSSGRVSTLIDGNEDLIIPEVILAECGFVLASNYRLPREVIVDNLVALLRKKNIDTLMLSKSLAEEALLLCRPSRRVSFADALTWAAAISSGIGVVYSLDRRFPSADIELRTVG